MAIAGNLKTMELAELLQWLSQGQKTGTLVVDNGRVQKRIFFKSGAIVSSASTDPKEYLGHFLVSHGFLDEAQLAEAAQRQEQDKALLGSILVDMGVLDVPQLERMLRLKAEETIYALFEWREGKFHFEDGELPAYKMVPISLDVTGLILEASRRLDEMQRIRAVIPGNQAIPVSVVDDLPAADPKLEDGQRHILAMVDDRRTVEEIALETHASEYYVCETLFPQVQARRVKIVVPRGGGAISSELPAFQASNLLRRAKDHLATGQHREAHRHLQAARSLEPENREIQREAEQAEKAIRMALEKEGLTSSAVPELDVSYESLTRVKVSPKAGFLLSRINGTYDLAAILKISPIPTLEALFEIRELVRAGLVRLGKGKGSWGKGG